MLWHIWHSLTSLIWIEWDIFPTCFCFLLRIASWQLWQTASNSHILWCLQPEDPPKVSGVSDTRPGFTKIHTSKWTAHTPLKSSFTYQMSVRRHHRRVSTEGIKVRWEAESLHDYSGWMSAFLRAPGRGWATQNVEMPMTKPNSRLILSETNCKQGVQELFMLFLCIHWLIKCGLNGWMWDFVDKHEWLQWQFCFSVLLTENVSIYVPNIPEPTNRAELLTRTSRFPHIINAVFTRLFIYLAWLTENIILPFRLEKCVFGWEDRQQNVVDFWWWLQSLSKD